MSAFQMAMPAAQVLFMLAGFALGGPADKAGGALLLASLWCCGACIGWALRGGEKGGDR